MAEHWLTVRAEESGDGLIISAEDAERWGLEADRRYEGRLLPDGRFRISLSLPEAQRVRDCLPLGHEVLEQADRPDGLVAQTVRIKATGDEYERVVHADEAYSEGQ